MGKERERMGGAIQRVNTLKAQLREAEAAYAKAVIAALLADELSAKEALGVAELIANKDNEFVSAAYEAGIREVTEKVALRLRAQLHSDRDIVKVYRYEKLEFRVFAIGTVGSAILWWRR